jgi:hypothetical protein
MLVRDVDGKINIISRKNCKNDFVYYKKLYNLRLQYTTKYNSIVINGPKPTTFEKVVP